MTRQYEKKATHNPVSFGSDNASDKGIGQQEPRVLRSTGDASDALDRSSVIKVMEQPYDDEKMAMLQFMEEPVTIRVATSTDPQAEQVFEINVNGKLEFFRRGETKTVKRYIVDRLMRLKQTVFSQKEVLNKEGIKDILHIPHTGLKYDFSITEDKNPLGRSWERAVLAERG